MCILLTFIQLQLSFDVNLVSLPFCVKLSRMLIMGRSSECSETDALQASACFVIVVCLSVLIVLVLTVT